MSNAKSLAGYIFDIADRIKKGVPLIPLPRGSLHATILFNGKVVPKGRPRVGKNAVYTPEKTRQFETAVKEAGKEQMAAQKKWALSGSVEVDLTIYDEIPASWESWMKVLGVSQYTFKNDRSDLDNKAKAIFDALNGVAYKDDKQIVRMIVSRRYSDHDGFRLKVTPVGLSTMMMDNLKKLLK